MPCVGECVCNDRAAEGDTPVTNLALIYVEPVTGCEVLDKSLHFPRLYAIRTGRLGGPRTQLLAELLYEAYRDIFPSIYHAVKQTGSTSEWNLVPCKGQPLKL